MLTEFEARVTHPVSMLEQWTALEGRAFVLGVPNALGQHVLTVGSKRWIVAQGEAKPGDRVRVTHTDDTVLWVERLIEV